jgi:glycosyltransferase involved in cell wall biosynthesis
MSSLLSELPPPPPGKKGWPWTEESKAPSASAPSVSIVVPSYNQAAYLEETIRSLLLQNYPDLEVVVIDGGSTDGSTAILNKYNRWLRFCVSEPDKGQSDAIQKGIQHCTGEWFNWINSDDLLAKDALTSLAPHLVASTDVVAGFCTIFESSSGAEMKTYRAVLHDTPEGSILDHKTCQPSTFFRREIITRLGGPPDSLHYAMDLAIWSRYISCYGQTRISLIDTPVSRFRIHGDSKTSLYESRFDGDERRIYRHIADQLGCSDSLLQEVCQEGLAASWQTRALDKDRYLTLLFIKYSLNPAFALFNKSDYKGARRGMLRYIKSEFARLDMKILGTLLICLLPGFVVEKIRGFRRKWTN